MHLAVAAPAVYVKIHSPGKRSLVLFNPSTGNKIKRPERRPVPSVHVVQCFSADVVRRSLFSSALNLISTLPLSLFIRFFRIANSERTRRGSERPTEPWPCDSLRLRRRADVSPSFGPRISRAVFKMFAQS